MQMVKTPIGVVFTDSLRDSVGAAAFSIDHDFFIKQDQVVRTASGGGGTLLTEDTDYTLGGEDTVLSAETTAAVGAGRNVMHTITVINAAYQACDLYFSGKFVADALDPTRITTMGYLALAADHTILDCENYRTYGMTTVAANLTLTLPTAADNVGKRVRLVKSDAGAGTAILDGEGAEKIGSKGVQTTFTLYGQGDWVEVESNGTLWEVVGMEFNALAYTPTFTGFGTPSSVSFSWVRKGGDAEVIGIFTGGTPIAVEARISLPVSLISDAALIPSTMGCGIMLHGNVGAEILYCLIESGVGYITFGRQTATNAALTKLNGNLVGGAGEILSVQFKVPISIWNG